jgi:hypothetical protein
MDVNKLSVELKRNEGLRSTLKDKIQSLDHDKASLENKIHCSDLSNREMRKKLEKQIEELKKTNVQLATRDVQYIAKMKRDELNYDKLQKSLQTLMKSKEKAIKAGFDASDKAIKQFTEKHSAAVSKNPEIEFRSAIALTYETRMNAFINENNTLRSSLAGLQQQVDEVLAAHNNTNNSRQISKSAALPRVGGEDMGEDGGKASDGGVVDAASFEMPSEWIASNVEADMKSKLSHLRSTLTKINEREQQIVDSQDIICTPPADDQYQILRRCLAEAKSVIAEQDALLQASINGGFSTTRRRDSMESTISMDETLQETFQQITKREKAASKCAAVSGRGNNSENSGSIMGPPLTPSTSGKRERKDRSQSLVHTRSPLSLKNVNEGSSIELPIPATPATKALLDSIMMGQH